MKLKALDRVLLAILLIIAIVFAFVLLGVASHLVRFEVVAGFIELFYADARNAWILAGSALVLLLICIKLLLCGRGNAQKPDTAAAPASTLMQQTELGGTFISLDAVDGMVQKHCRAQERVRDCHSTLRALDDGVTIGIRLTVLPDTDVAALTQQMQASLREYIQSLTGINVKEIGILVESAAAEPVARVG